jgi:predicted nucleic acid-binding protein
MNGDKILVDTNIFIHLLNRHPKISDFLDKEWWFNFITEIELLGKPGIVE